MNTPRITVRRITSQRERVRTWRALYERAEAKMHASRREWYATKRNYVAARRALAELQTDGSVVVDAERPE